MRKTLVIDTNVLLYDTNALTTFDNSEVIVPLAVLEELDAMKRFHNDLGKNARLVMRSFDSLRGKGKNELHKGIQNKKGSLIRIDLNQISHSDNAFPLRMTGMKNQVLMAAYHLSKQKDNVVFVSKDFASRVKAEALGVQTADYNRFKVSYQDIFYSKIHEREVDKKIIDRFLTQGKVKMDSDRFRANEFCSLKSSEKSQLMGRYDKDSKCLVALQPLPEDLWGTRPRNIQQRCALELLLSDDIKLVTLVGQAGTGKTLLALACALRKVFDLGTYNKILVSRPIVPLGKDIGYLPGLKEEKLYHWMQPIYDNLEFLCHSSSEDMTGESLRWITESKKLEMEAVTYIRGRSLPSMFIIVDEAQNLTPHEVKTIISRAGEGTKVVLTGDPTQIDNPYLDEDSNGLTFAVGRFADHTIHGHMLLDKTERSELASIAASVL